MRNRKTLRALARRMDKAVAQMDRLLEWSASCPPEDVRSRGGCLLDSCEGLVFEVRKIAGSRPDVEARLAALEAAVEALRAVVSGNSAQFFFHPDQN